MLTTASECLSDMRVTEPHAITVPSLFAADSLSPNVLSVSALEELSTQPRTNLENRNGSHWQSQITQARGLSVDCTPLQRQNRH
jgi:hypothetical protein